MKPRFFIRCWVGLLGASMMFDSATGTEVAGVKLTFVDDSGQATLSAKAIGKYALQIEIDSAKERTPLTLQVELPKTGRDVWPFNE
ncbi:MAG: hypothetical protein CMJ48_05940, partial [Planctomycetaceae bacterium]|nr:hypothetical protein [Planctomycetaceae bacterium]